MNARAVLRACAALGAVAYLAAMLATGARPGRGQFVAFEAAGLMAEPPEAVHAVELAQGARRWRFERADGSWTLAGQPLAGAAAGHLALAVKFLHTARPVRTLEGPDVAPADPAYGLAAPELAVAVTLDDGSRLDLAFGGATPDGDLQYLRAGAPPAVHLMSGFVGAEWRAVADSLP